MLDTAKEGTTILIDSSASDAVQDGAHAADADVASVELRGLQPRCDGPKLHPFAHRRAKIKFVKRLSDPDHEGQGHVFQVDIARKTYALKIFNFYDDESDVEDLVGPDLDAIGLDLLHAHSDPFYNECRAFGKLIESNLNGRVAVRCYGYTTIPAELVHQIGYRFQVDDWIKDAEDHQYYQLPLHRQVFRATVKDLIPDDVQLTHMRVKRMRRDLLRIREQGVYPMDIKASNYRGALLVDLSSARTEPHFWLDMCSWWDYERTIDEDLVQFDKMVKEAGVKTSVIAFTKSYRSKLRPRDGVRKKYSK
ncbi:MAG: hypothetical protein Q9185_006049 [Variospora sp. 1 TL-2023]